MKAFVLATIVVFLCLQTAQSRPKSATNCDYRQDEIEDILTKIPAEEQQAFLKYHLQLGYDLEQKVNEWPDNVTSEFAAALFKYAQNKHQITDPEKLRKAENIVCFPNGTCVDIGDIGVHP